MSALKELATQGSLKEFIEGLGEIADNLNLHVNHSLSKAHGITAYPCSYKDSGGDTISTRTVRFTLGHAVYYSPAILPSVDTGVPDPGPHGTGTGMDLESTVDPNNDSSVGKPAQSYYKTDLGDELVTGSTTTNLVLLGHAASNHDVVHPALTVVSRDVFTTCGPVQHKVGRYVIYLKLDGVDYAIPADTSPTGPPQFARIKMLPPDHAIKTEADQSDIYNYAFSPTVYGGTTGITYSYEYWAGSVWLPFPTTRFTIPFQSHGKGVDASYDPTTGAVVFIGGTPGGDEFDWVRVRLTATNAYGSIHVDYQTGADLTFQLNIQDESPGI